MTKTPRMERAHLTWPGQAIPVTQWAWCACQPPVSITSVHCLHNRILLYQLELQKWLLSRQMAGLKANDFIVSSESRLNIKSQPSLTPHFKCPGWRSSQTCTQRRQNWLNIFIAVLLRDLCLVIFMFIPERGRFVLYFNSIGIWCRNQNIENSLPTPWIVALSTELTYTALAFRKGTFCAKFNKLIPSSCKRWSPF